MYKPSGGRRVGSSNLISSISYFTVFRSCNTSSPGSFGPLNNHQDKNINIIIWVASSEKVPSNMHKMHRFRLSSTCATYQPGRCSPFHAVALHSYILYSVSVSGQWRPWSDCTNVQAGLGLCCPHMSEDMFLHNTAHIFIIAPDKAPL